jgi:hypothetical protein
MLGRNPEWVLIAATLLLIAVAGARVAIRSGG